MTKQGGARPDLPIPSDYATFDRKWGIYYITAHGSLRSNFFVIPENTYILNIAVAGKGCHIFKWEIENLIYQRSEGARGLPIKQTIYNLFKDRKFYKDFHLYNPAIPLETQPTSLAFYEPGDFLLDSTISFYNHVWPIFLQGVYEIPIPIAIKDRVFAPNKRFYPEDENASTVNAGTIFKVPKAGDVPGEIEQQIFNIPENLWREKIFTPAGTKTKFQLKDIVREIRAIDTAKGIDRIRLIIVNTCRIPGDPSVTPSMLRSASETARRVPNPKAVEPEGPLSPSYKLERMEFQRLNLDTLIQIMNQLFEKYKNVSTEEEKAILAHPIEIGTRIFHRKEFSRDELLEFLETANTLIPLNSQITRLLI